MLVDNPHVSRLSFGVIDQSFVQVVGNPRHKTDSYGSDFASLERRKAAKNLVRTVCDQSAFHPVVHGSDTGHNPP